MSGVGAGDAAGDEMDAGEVAKRAREQSLRPEEELDRNTKYNRRDARDQMRNLAQMQGVSAGLSNNLKNLTAERALALNSQKFAADNVRDQLNTLAQNRANNTQAILGAMNSVSNMF